MWQIAPCSVSVDKIRHLNNSPLVGEIIMDISHNIVALILLNKLIIQGNSGALISNKKDNLSNCAASPVPLQIISPDCFNPKLWQNQHAVNKNCQK